MEQDERLRLRNEILWELEKNEYDMNVLPHYGMVPDFTPRYHRLAQLVELYLDGEHTQLAKEQRKAEERERHSQRETKGPQTDITGC